MPSNLCTPSRCAVKAGAPQSCFPLRSGPVQPSGYRAVYPSSLGQETAIEIESRRKRYGLVRQRLTKVSSPSRLISEMAQ